MKKIKKIETSSIKSVSRILEPFRANPRISCIDWANSLRILWFSRAISLWELYCGRLRRIFRVLGAFRIEESEGIDSLSLKAVDFLLCSSSMIYWAIKIAFKILRGAVFFPLIFCYHFMSEHVEKLSIPFNRKRKENPTSLLSPVKNVLSFFFFFEKIYFIFQKEG